MTRTAVIWDIENHPSNYDSDIYYWSSFASGENQYSIPEYVENNGDTLRGKYLSFVHELSRKQIGSKKLIEHLQYDNEFSFWWMTHLAEKSPYKSSGIYNCIRMYALEELLRDSNYTNIILESADKNLAKSMSQLADSLNLKFRFRKKRVLPSYSLIRYIYLKLPYSIRGLISLRHLLKKWRFRSCDRLSKQNNSKGIFISTYFYNLDLKKARKNIFYSRQWEDFPEFLNRQGMNINWLHHYLDMKGNPDINESIQLLSNFNLNNKSNIHEFLESYISLKIIYRVLSKWLWLNLIYIRLLRIKSQFFSADSIVWTWPFLKNDWKTSIVGPISVCNIIWIELFDAAIKSLPDQKIALYIWENQGWECALLKAWRKYFQVPIYAVQHATVRYWGLNNYDDIRDVYLDRRFAKPMPDIIAVNGQAAWDQFIKAKIPAEKLQMVEAIRYQYLLDYQIDAYNNNLKLKKIKSDSEINILILGDFSKSHTEKMLRCINQASELLCIKLHISLKSHPSCHIDINNYSMLDINMIDKPLSEILNDFDIAFSSNTTSAGLDAFLAGLPVIVFIDGGDFNHSPLRGIDGVKFAATPEELADLISNYENINHSSKITDFFNVDHNYPKWKKIIQN